MVARPEAPPVVAKRFVETEGMNQHPPSAAPERSRDLLRQERGGRRAGDDHLLPSLDLGRVPVIRLTTMRSYTAVVERCPDTRLYVGYVPGFPGAHSQGDTLDELNENLKEVIAMLLDDGEPVLDGEYVGTQVVVVA